MFKQDSLGQAVAERIVDLFSTNTPWSQHLWHTNPIDSLRHLQSLVTSNAHDGAKSGAIAAARGALESDMFVPRPSLAGFLKSLAAKPEKLVPESHGDFKLQALEYEIRSHYGAWIQDFLSEVGDSQSMRGHAADAEAIALQLAAYLRASGMSGSWIANFFSFHLHHNPDLVTLAGAFELSLKIVSGGSGWTVFVPLDGRHSFNVEAPPLYRRREFERQFQSAFPGEDVPDNRGGIVLFVQGIDKYTAKDSLRLELERLRMRNRVASSRRSFRLNEIAYVSPGGWRFPLEESAVTHVVFRELDRLGGSRMFERRTDELEAAIDLLVAGERTSTRAAVIAMWASLETLFADPSDFGELSSLADRASDILTCLYVRDAYLGLARGYARTGGDDVADRLRAAASDADRATIVHEALASDHLLGVGPTLGEIARKRTQKLTPSEVARIRRNFSVVLRRLYDLRNQIVHAGIVSAYGTELIYAEATVLLSALIDHLLAASDGGRSAREVAGRASWLVERLASHRASVPSLVEL